VSRQVWSTFKSSQDSHQVPSSQVETHDDLNKGSLFGILAYYIRNNALCFKL